MNWNFIVLIVSLSLPLVSWCSPKANVFDLEFIIDDLSNEAYAWPPLGNNWSKIKKGSKVPIGTLLKIPDNGLIRIRIPEELTSNPISSKGNILTFQGIQYLRIDDLLVRKVQMSPLYLSTVPDKVQKVDNIDSVKTFWEDSWNKVLAILDPEGQDVQKIIENQKAIDEGLSISDDVIQKFPISTSISYEIGKRGATISAKWPSDRSVDIYDVYIWTSDHKSGSPFNSVKTNFTSEHLYDNGEFNIKVMSRDKRKQSNTVTFVVDTKDQERQLKLQSEQKKLEVISPKENQTIITQKNLAEIDFIFESSQLYSRYKPVYYLIIKDSNHNLITHVRMEEPGLSYPLKEGSYFWAITSQGQPPKDLKHTLTLIPWRNLQIRGLSRKGPLNLSIRDFKDLLNSPKDSDIKLDIEKY